MFAHWIQIAELILLPLGLWIGYSAGRICRQDEGASFRNRRPRQIRSSGTADLPRRDSGVLICHGRRE